jgi:uncharacterized repeat protein (TIGR02543 family)
MKISLIDKKQIIRSLTGVFLVGTCLLGAPFTAKAERDPTPEDRHVDIHFEYFVFDPNEATTHSDYSYVRDVIKSINYIPTEVINGNQDYLNDGSTKVVPKDDLWSDVRIDYNVPNDHNSYTRTVVTYGPNRDVLRWEYGTHPATGETKSGVNNFHFTTDPDGFNYYATGWYWNYNDVNIWYDANNRCDEPGARYPSRGWYHDVWGLPTSPIVFTNIEYPINEYSQNCRFQIYYVPKKVSMKISGDHLSHIYTNYQNWVFNDITYHYNTRPETLYWNSKPLIDSSGINQSNKLNAIKWDWTNNGNGREWNGNGYGSITANDICYTQYTYVHAKAAPGYRITGYRVNGGNWKSITPCREVTNNDIPFQMTNVGNNTLEIRTAPIEPNYANTYYEHLVFDPNEGVTGSDYTLVKKDTKNEPYYANLGAQDEFDALITKIEVNNDGGVDYDNGLRRIVRYGKNMNYMSFRYGTNPVANTNRNLPSDSLRFQTGTGGFDHYATGWYWNYNSVSGWTDYNNSNSSGYYPSRKWYTDRGLPSSSTTVFTNMEYPFRGSDPTFQIYYVPKKVSMKVTAASGSYLSSVRASFTNWTFNAVNYNHNKPLIGSAIVRGNAVNLSGTSSISSSAICYTQYTEVFATAATGYHITRYRINGGNWQNYDGKSILFPMTAYSYNSNWGAANLLEIETKPNTYTVNIYPNKPGKASSNVAHPNAVSGWTWSSNHWTKTFTYDSTTIGNAPSIFYSLTGWTINGTYYYTNSTCTGTTYTSGSKNLTSANGGTIDLYVKWTENTYQVVFKANGGAGSMNYQSFTYEESKALTANAFTKTGYTFKNWNLNEGGTSTSYSDKQTVSKLTATNGGKVYLYAQWTPNTYTVNVYPNKPSTASANVEHPNAVSGWSWSSDHWTRTFTYDSTTIGLDPSSFYSLDGWTIDNAKFYTNTACTAGNYTKNSKNLATSGTVNLYVKWTANNYKVKYIVNGSTNSTDSTATVTYDSSFTLPSPGRTGYTFNGWLVSEGSNKYTNNGTKTNPLTNGVSTYLTGSGKWNLTSVSGGTVTLIATWKHAHPAASVTGSSMATSSPYLYQVSAPSYYTSNKLGYWVGTNQLTTLSWRVQGKSGSTDTYYAIKSYGLSKNGNVAVTTNTNTAITCDGTVNITINGDNNGEVYPFVSVDCDWHDNYNTCSTCKNKVTTGDHVSIMGDTKVPTVTNKNGKTSGSVNGTRYDFLYDWTSVAINPSFTSLDPASGVANAKVYKGLTESSSGLVADKSFTSRTTNADGIPNWSAKTNAETEYLIVLTDNVGNKSTYKVLTRHDDGIPEIEEQPSKENETPTITTQNSTKNYTYGWKNEPITFSFKASDSLSGVKTFTLYLADSSFNKKTKLKEVAGNNSEITYTANAEGISYYVLEAIDQPGNSVTIRVTTKIDYHAPVISGLDTLKTMAANFSAALDKEDFETDAWKAWKTQYDAYVESHGSAAGFAQTEPTKYKNYSVTISATDYPDNAYFSGYTEAPTKESSGFPAATVSDTLTTETNVPYGLMVVIKNTDNGLTRRWIANTTEGQTGKQSDTTAPSIQIDLLEEYLKDDQPLFSGNLELHVYATDRVGNVATEVQDLQEFTMQLDLRSMYYPEHDESRIYMRGEAVVLEITTTGYADALRIEMPEEFITHDTDTGYALLPDYATVFDPANNASEAVVGDWLVQYITYPAGSDGTNTTQVQVVLPFTDIVDGDSFTFTVTAYKGDGTAVTGNEIVITPEGNTTLASRTLQRNVSFAIEGTVLDDFRTTLTAHQ